MLTQADHTAIRDLASMARKVLRRDFGVKGGLLADPISNPKVAKNAKVRVLTAPLHLAPASLSGVNVCPMATAGCIAACLHTAGNPAYMAGKSSARIARTKAFFGNRAAFMAVLVAEIAATARQARAKRMRCGIRLNATSDIVWEAMPVTINGKRFANVMAAFPHVTFYDYTKRHNRRALPSNYSLTYSLAENNDVKAGAALNAGMNVAAVFNIVRGHALPSTYAIDGYTFPVIDGDIHDYRPVDPRGVIVGLRAKGKARGDTSGFVRMVA